MVGFVKLYFPVFLLGAVFGKLIELSGFSRSIVAAAIRILGRRHAIPVIVLVCALLTYGGVSLFVVAFAVYPFAAELFRQSGIPQTADPRHRRPRGILVYHGRPARHAADPEYYSHQFLRHQRTGRPPRLGLIGSLFIIIFGLLWLERQRRKAQASGEGYGTDLQNEPETPDDIDLPHPLIAIAPLLLVGVLNLLFTHWIPQWYGASHELNLPGTGEACRHRSGENHRHLGGAGGAALRHCAGAGLRLSQYPRPAGGGKSDGGGRGYSRGDEHRL